MFSTDSFNVVQRVHVGEGDDHSRIYDVVPFLKRFLRKKILKISEDFFNKKNK